MCTISALASTSSTSSYTASNETLGTMAAVPSAPPSIFSSETAGTIASSGSTLCYSA